MYKDQLWPCIFVAGLIAISVSCGASSTVSVVNTPPPAVCDPTQAAEVLSVTVQNTGAVSLENYAVAAPFDKNTFNFALAAADGSDLAVWDPVSKRPLPFWLESYDPQIGKAVLWVNAAKLAPQALQSMLVTAGVVPHCVLQSSNGYSVFPFFSDAQDANNWNTENHLSVTNTVTTGPLTVQDRQVITSDGTYNSTPAVAEASNGDWVLTYRKGTAHVNDPLVILRRSQDKGKTWGPEVIYFDTSGPDPALVRTPGGDLLIEFVKLDQNSVAGAAYGRSTDNGLTWGPFTFLAQPPNQVFAFGTQLFTNGPTMYGVGYGPATFDTNESPFFWQSADDGLTWTKISEMRNSGDPGLNETSVASAGMDPLFALMRGDDSMNTFGRNSTDQGQTWGLVISYTEQVGVIQDPVLIQAGNTLLLLGRESMPPFVLSNPSAYTRQFVAFVSYDGGKTFGYGTVLDAYTGLTIDGGYSWPLLLPDGRVYVAYYADSHNLRQPDIKSLVLSFASPVTAPSHALHIFSQFDAGRATRTLNVAATRYSVDFRFRSREIAGGSQFSVALAGNDSNGTPRTLANWELPSIHAADPTNTFGLIANNQFVTVSNSFNYQQAYRIRTIVDETQQQQEGQVLDLFGVTLNTSGVQPLAQPGASVHVSNLTIGNNSSLRVTDTLLDFIFARQAAAAEPQVTVTRLH